MDTSALLLDGYERIREEVHEVLDGLTEEELNARLDSGANSIAWLVWHLTRVQDDHLAEAAGHEQVWTSEAFDDRFALDLPAGSTGFGHSSRDVAKVHLAEPSLLRDYYDAVHTRTTAFLQELDDASLDRVVDESWDPPTTLGVRLVSVLGDDLEHAGQAAYVKGVLRRR
ncbi:mycothiol transferase [Streptomyces sulphureus]|uniref:mycothiol transferase n=1 Tax=Streptomyces sulphureus TaxID=47758 RepID=UPI0003743F94|nr:DinB family protein [Streptomyces sulphureus]